MLEPLTETLAVSILYSPTLVLIIEIELSIEFNLLIGVPEAPELI